MTTILDSADTEHVHHHYGQGYSKQFSHGYLADYRILIQLSGILYAIRICQRRRTHNFMLKVVLESIYSKIRSFKDKFWPALPFIPHASSPVSHSSTHYFSTMVNSSMPGPVNCLNSISLINNLTQTKGFLCAMPCSRCWRAVFSVRCS